VTRSDALKMQARLFPAAKTVCSVEPTLPEIVLSVRMAISGAADPWPREQLAEVREMLKARLETWAASEDDIDKGVRSMVSGVVTMLDGELSGGDSAVYANGLDTAEAVIERLAKCDGIAADCAVIGWRQAKLLLAHIGRGDA